MQAENRRQTVPLAHYTAKLGTLTKASVQKRLPEILCREDAYILTFLGRQFAISCPEYAIRALDGGAVPGLTAQIFLLRYLLEGQSCPENTGWKTFRELPWGELYAKPFSQRVLSRAAFAFGSRLPDFRAACGQLGALPLPQSDAGFQFDFIGSFRMQLLIWEGDEEFPPSAQLLYSSGWGDGFSAEDRVVAGDLLISAVKALMQPQTGDSRR